MVTLTIAEIKDLAQMCGLVLTRGCLADTDQDDAEITVSDCPAIGVRDDNLTVRHYAHIAFFAEDSEEGCCPLGPELPTPPVSVRPPRRKTMDSPQLAAGTSAPACWAVIAYRWGWINAHQYVVRVTNDLQAATDAADAEAMHRGGKYGVTVWDNDGAAVYHAPSSYREAKAHTNYRTDMFEAVGLHVVVGLEDGKPLTADQIEEIWKREVQMQQIMERADHNQPNPSLHRPEPAAGSGTVRGVVGHSST